MLFKVNYFTAGKGKLYSFCNSKDDPFMGVCGIPHNLFSNDFLHCSSIQLFLTKAF